MSGQPLTTRDLGPLADDPETLDDSERRLNHEQRELFRIRACTLMADKAWAAKADPETLRWARRWSAVKPLGRALSTGEPS